MNLQDKLKQEQVATVVDASDPKSVRIDMSRISQHQFFMWLVLNSIKHEDIERIAPLVDGKRDFSDVHVELRLNNVQVDVLPALTKMFENYTENVNAAARELYEEKLDGSKFEKLSELVRNFGYEIRQEGKRLFPDSSPILTASMRSRYVFPCISTVLAASLRGQEAILTLKIGPSASCAAIATARLLSLCFAGDG